MELFFSICAFLLFFSIAVKIFRNTKPVNLPPGPRPLPIIGNMHQLNHPLPHRILTDLAKKYGPLMHLQLGEISTVVASSPAVAKEVMNDHDIIFASRPVLLSPTILNYGGTDIAFAPYGEYWRQLRKICTIELLSSRRVQTFRSLREKEVLNLIRSISSEQGSVVNLSKKIYSLTYSITAQAVKTRVIVNAWAIGRDPKQWTEPEKFNPDRFLNSEIDFRGKTFSFIPFGAGRRICPGISFALANVELPLAQLLYHFDWKLPGQLKQEELDMTEIFGLAVGRKHDLNLIPIPYRPCSLKLQ